MRYKPGIAARLGELNGKYVYPSWPGVTSIVFASERWDRMDIMPLKEGFSALKYKTLPERVPAMTWRVRQFGQAAADKVDHEYGAMIEEDDDEIAFIET